LQGLRPTRNCGCCGALNAALVVMHPVASVCLVRVLLSKAFTY